MNYVWKLRYKMVIFQLHYFYAHQLFDKVDIFDNVKITFLVVRVH